MVEASISLRMLDNRKRIFISKYDANEVYIVLRDDKGIPLDIGFYKPRIKIYHDSKKLIEKELEVIDPYNGICKLMIDEIEQGIYNARIELEHYRFEYSEEFKVVVQE